jgi:hypothetical protein
MGVLDISTEEVLAELPDDPQAAFGMVLCRAFSSPFQKDFVVGPKELQNTSIADLGDGIPF